MSLIIGLNILTREQPIGFIIIIFGSFFSWISSIGMYAFGRLVENTDILRQRFSEETHNNISNENTADDTLPQTICPHCGTEHDFDDLRCPNCGKATEI